ncbi:MAG: HEPN domain-containing protein [Candidatus Aenigmarchaeota archaeon]|nr:HEPN domain-containing protein [Candidatus Aenigmarchaeota archaeon]
MVEIFIDRANNELLAAESLKKLSEEAVLKKQFQLPTKITFYSSVISHSYYAIFYAAKAILMKKGIKTSAPEIHKKTIEEFEKNLVKTGILDVKLLEIYKTMAVRADGLLEIFKDERWKRGNFTYNTIPQANREPSEDSLSNAKLFVSNISRVIDGM